jgi:solute carrier family 39 (zinc transporter), member 1/2/3
MSGFIAMVSVLIVVAIEMFFATKGARHSHGGMDLEGLRSGKSFEMPRRSESLRALRQEGIVTNGRNGGHEAEESVIPSPDPQARFSSASAASASVNKPLPPEPPFEDDSDLDLGEDDYMNPDASSTGLLNGSVNKPLPPTQTNGNRPSHSRHVSFASSPTPPGQDSPRSSSEEQRLVLQCLLLEAGILFHSVFIGMALSVSVGPAFIVLLIAISFHQTFEGLALGSRIASISTFATQGGTKPWIMCCLYGITTPVGQAIGLGVQGLYDPASQFGLLMVGIVNAVSSGLLLYAGLVQLLAEDFLSETSYQELQGRRRLEACGSVVAGSMLMAFVGECVSELVILVFEYLANVMLQVHLRSMQKATERQLLIVFPSCDFAFTLFMPHSSLFMVKLETHLPTTIAVNTLVSGKLAPCSVWTMLCSGAPCCCQYGRCKRLTRQRQYKRVLAALESLSAP